VNNSNTGKLSHNYLLKEKHTTYQITTMMTMMMNFQSNYFNTPEPMDIDPEPMDINNDINNVCIEFGNMEIHNDTNTCRSKRRHDDITKDEEDNGEGGDLVYPPFKKERSIRKAKRSTRHVIVAPRLFYFVV